MSNWESKPFTIADFCSFMSHSEYQLKEPCKDIPIFVSSSEFRRLKELGDELKLSYNERMK